MESGTGPGPSTTPWPRRAGGVHRACQLHQRPRPTSTRLGRSTRGEGSGCGSTPWPASADCSRAGRGHMQGPAPRRNRRPPVRLGCDSPVRSRRHLCGGNEQSIPRVEVPPVRGHIDTADLAGRRREERQRDSLGRERARRASAAAKQEAKPRPLKVVTATTPASRSRGAVPQRDITLVKAALLYADNVELLSPGAAMPATMAFVASRGEAELLEVLQVSQGLRQHDKRRDQWP
jgi:hypothetical protein